MINLPLVTALQRWSAVRHCPQPNVIVDGSSLTEVGSTEPADTSGSDNRFTTVGETITLKSRLPLIKWVYRPSQGHSA